MKTKRLFLPGTFVWAFLLVLVFLGGKTAPAEQTIEESWKAPQQGKAAALIRHAEAPGTGDPPGFKLEDCSTQRNLSEEGRSQARRIGDFFRARGIQKASVYSSQWFRCLETARLLGLGPHEELPALDSFFADPARGPEQTEKIRAFLFSLARKGPVVLVTHQVNITALAAVFPSPGEIIVFPVDKQSGGKVLGRFIP